MGIAPTAHMQDEDCFTWWICRTRGCRQIESDWACFYSSYFTDASSWWNTGLCDFDVDDLFVQPPKVGESKARRALRARWESRLQRTCKTKTALIDEYAERADVGRLW